MIHATEQQLQLIAAKAQKLEASLQAQIADLKGLKDAKAAASAETQRLREALAAAEERERGLTEHHDAAASKLKATALEYSKAQLLQKKYHNTLKELNGHCRAVVSIVGGQHGGDPNFVVADECTINAVPQRKGFVFDGVVDEKNADNAAAVVNIDAMVTDCLAGYNVGLLSFGPAGSGKSTAMFGLSGAGASSGVTSSVAPDRSASHLASFQSRFGPQEHYHQQQQQQQHVSSAPPATGGLAATFLRTLFGSLELNEVTHFNIRCKFAELEQDHVVDLLSDFGDVVSFGGAPTDVSSLPVQSLGEALQLLKVGLDRTASRHARRRTRSHLIFSVSVENFNIRGHFRRATVMIADLSGAASGSASSVDALWANQGINALCDVIAARSAAAAASGATRTSDTVPASVRNNPLIQTLSELLFGNCRTTMLCCINLHRNTPDEVLSALTYALQFKSVRNNPAPYDVGPELQRLQMEVNGFTE